MWLPLTINFSITPILSAEVIGGTGVDWSVDWWEAWTDKESVYFRSFFLLFEKIE